MTQEEIIQTLGEMLPTLQEVCALHKQRLLDEANNKSESARLVEEWAMAKAQNEASEASAAAELEKRIYRGQPAWELSQNL